MPIITLPDGSEKSFDQAISVFEVAKSIGSGLAKATLFSEDTSSAIVNNQSKTFCSLIKPSRPTPQAGGKTNIENLVILMPVVAR
jgi:hypothetical protein